MKVWLNMSSALNDWSYKRLTTYRRWTHLSVGAIFPFVFFTPAVLAVTILSLFYFTFYVYIFSIEREGFDLSKPLSKWKRIFRKKPYRHTPFLERISYLHPLKWITMLDEKLSTATATTNNIFGDYFVCHNRTDTS